ncbi:uncharacterized protein E6C27_scaffold675G001360 [Cucumis melo var. makuwa]|uniref:Reverse transcriptase domain-containing protein n=1 Tax=Cucumis melo var. makuwa TaxID=1194695 RepID=A0A5A7U9E3_CUCMM|nr:uncharacterized protein E6C27_scaffold675G001360 [Cucumis melo var. makuwa]
MNQLGISVEELSNSKLVIQGFNQGAQQAIDTFRLEIVIGDLQASTIFHEIDSRTTYKMKVDADSKPFTKAESHFVDAKFYTKSEDVSEVISIEVPVTKGTFKYEKEMIITKKSNKGDAPNGQQNDEPMTQTKSRAPETEKIAILQKKVLNPHVLRYIPLSQLFQRVSTSIAKDKNQASTCGSTRLSAFQRLNTIAKKVQSISLTPTTRKSAFKRLSVSVTRGQKKASISVPSKSSLVTGDEKIRIAVPSRMKRKMFVSVNTEGSLKVKPHDVVFTRPEDNEPEDKVDVAGCCHVTIEETFEEDAEAAPLSLENGGQLTINELKEVNLGTKEEPRPTFISTQNEYVNLLKAYKDVFAWSYKEMPGLDPKVVVHRLAIKPEHRPVKQAQRQFRPELISKIEEEVNKLIEAEFIREVKYSTWIANIFPVRKKNGQLRICVDFRDLNNACPKDDFRLPIMEIMIDETAGNEALSFMDGSSEYNQIRMALHDKEKIAFRTPKGIYCYKVMPFRLKNAGATYQRTMQRIFDDMLHKHVECYVDDLVVKSKKKCDHLKDLKLLLDRLRKYQLRMNPLKCAFGVTSRKFLGFIVRHRGIEVDHSKIDAIQKMPSPKNLHELR